MPVQKALILDPWLEPLPSPGPVPHQRFKEEHLPSILIINSEKFTLWKDHFERLIEVGKSWTEGGWELLTIGTFYARQANSWESNASKFDPNTSLSRTSRSCHS